MNEGIGSLTSRYINRLSNYGNLPSKPIQTICKLDNKIDWKKVGANGWSVIVESIFETIKQSNTFPLNQFTAKSTFVGGNLPYVSGGLLSDGRVILCPFNSTTSIIWDPNNDTTVVPGGSYPGNSAFSSCVLLPNGEILFIPRGTACRVYNPFTNTIRTIGSAPATLNSYVTGVLMQDGRVYCIPNSSASALIIDPINNTTKYASGSYTNTGLLGYGGALLPDGRIFVATSTSNTPAWIYDPVKDNLINTSMSFPYGAQGCLLLPDETIFLSPINGNTYPMIYDWKKDTLRLGKPLLVDGASGGSTLLTDGTILLHPIGGPSITVYNPYSDTAKTVPGTISSSSFTNGIMLFDGRYIMFPRNGTSLVGYGIKQLSFSKEVLLSAHYNLRR